jgi:hypothetical protein
VSRKKILAAKRWHELFGSWIAYQEEFCGDTPTKQLSGYGRGKLLT